ncbi:ABC transporter ATP-binding protein [Desulfospira joergensenii]|uniref:ABC transporter ATP-binding protein n=1 Tax=Desulfospira joergensenii TaxID=53329 RepID=UPI0003B6F112|nr:ATP-binding cassette domain-containing protein [Desulfospira joergensenii]
MFEIKNVSFCHGSDLNWIFKDFSLRVAPGQVVGLSGPSGKGKTTLGRIAAGFLIPGKGQVLMNGKPLENQGYHPVQMVFQHPELAINPRWRAGKIIREGFSPDAGLLEKFEVSGTWLSRYPCELSGGQLARICLVRALGPGTRFLITDEATAMLDPLTQARIWKSLLAHCRRHSIGILAISHDRALLHRIADQTILDFGIKNTDQEKALKN